MDWFPSVVLVHLRRDRALFLNPECPIRRDADGSSAAPLRHKMTTGSLTPYSDSVF